MLEYMSYALLGGIMFVTSIVLWWFIGRTE
ncbi:conserved hypothetical protein [Nitrospira sp. ND1]|jgi:hypothetical protein|uniref:Uncharacterized protein n=1 Tax=Nitrospira defluvii TaxID=330214 RepID=D8PFX5_9BACT|nr:protein of unknown function [Nitrospira defluvii]SLM42076.1 conserved hypothetical protein [Nitrospira sp. ND1]